jgi:predicted ArsR family transcriptional regulator
MLDLHDLALLQSLATAGDKLTDGTALADELGMPGDEATDHLWHLQGEGLANMQLSGKRFTWSITETGRAQLPAKS